MNYSSYDIVHSSFFLQDSFCFSFGIFLLQDLVLYEIGEPSILDSLFTPLYHDTHHFQNLFNQKLNLQTNINLNYKKAIFIQTYIDTHLPELHPVSFRTISNDLIQLKTMQDFDLQRIKQIELQYRIGKTQYLFIGSGCLFIVSLFFFG